MFKKFLAALSLVAILSTSTAFAIDPLPGGVNAPSTGIVVANHALSAASFNPIATPVETLKVTFTLTKDADLYSYVLSSTGDVMAELVGTAATHAKTVAGAISLTWTGRQNNGANTAVLPDGTYTVKTFSSSKDNAGVVTVSDSSSQTVYLSTVNQTAPKISSFKVEPATFSPSTGETADIYFTTSKDGFITVQILQGANVVRTFTEYTNFYYDAGSFAINWDGKNDLGNIVADNVGTNTYTVKVTASVNNGVDFNKSTFAVKALTSVNVAVGSVKNFKINPDTVWNPIKGGIDVDYQLTEKVKSLHIQAKSGNKVVKILDDKNVDSGYYTEIWDGTDDIGNYIDAGTWTISIIADGVTATKNVTAKYTQPAVVEAFVSKDSFDPSKNEMQNLVFKIDAKAVVTVEVFQGTQKENKLVDELMVQKNNWYSVAWDGRDMDGAQVDNAGDWKFKISAKNPTAEDLLGNKAVSFQVAADTVNEKKSNVTNDTTSPAVYDDQQSEYIDINYSLDQDAQVFIAVYEGNSTGGKAKATLLDYVAQYAGDHNVSWDGRDTNGKTLADGVYTYKIIAKVGSNYKETETGTFVIGNSGDYITQPPFPPEPPETYAACEDGIDNDADGYTDLMDAGCDSSEDNDEYNYVVEPPVVENCGGYSDTKFVVNQNYEMCQAISWVSEQGIFQGYGDGSFGLNTPIKRTEVLKVVLKAFPSVTVLPSDGSNQGFWDVDTSEWYMPFVRTAKFYNMLQGYKDGSVGVNKHVTRAEFLKFALKGSSAFTGYQVPSYAFSYYADVDANSAWYKDFAGVAYDMGFFGYNYNGTGAKVNLYPEQSITRGEVALILYKMYNNYLLGYGPEYSMKGY